MGEEETKRRMCPQKKDPTDDQSLGKAALLATIGLAVGLVLCATTAGTAASAAVAAE